MRLIKSDALKTSLLYFVFTRIALILIGYCVNREFALHGLVRSSAYKSSDNLFLNFFETFDSTIYLKIAQEWYQNLLNNPTDHHYLEYSFFPLYPALIRLFHSVTGFSYFFSGLIISNICFIASGYFLYKISQKYFNMEIAKGSVIFMYACPVSFIYSGIFTESLYLMLILMAVYFASLEKWLYAGIAGMLLMLCRPTGIFVILPLVFMYFQSINFKLEGIRKNFLGIFLVLTGILILSVYHYIFSGEAFSFLAFYRTGFKMQVVNPFLNCYNWIINDYFTNQFLGIYSLVFVVLWLLFYRHLNVTFHIITLYSLVIPMCYTLMSMPRMILAAFPFFILLASVANKYRIQSALLIPLVLLQGYLFVCWCLGFGNVI